MTVKFTMFGVRFLDLDFIGVKRCFSTSSDQVISFEQSIPMESYRLGRPKIDGATERKVRRQLAKGIGILKVARSLGIGTGTVQRISGERAMSPRGAEQ